MNIGAETARLAGLQIDQLTKLRAGQMTLDQIERFNNLKPEAREERFGDWERPKPVSAPIAEIVKFGLLADLGIITVPASHVPGTYLSSFKERHQGGKKKSFYGYNDNVTDENFSNPTWVLKPGQKLWVRAYKQIVPGQTTSEERMAFLTTVNSRHTGAQGASLVFDQKRNQLPKGYWYGSFDEPERLWEDAGGSHRVPELVVGSDGDFGFSLGGFEDPWRVSHVILSFCDVPSGT